MARRGPEPSKDACGLALFRVHAPLSRPPARRLLLHEIFDQSYAEIAVILEMDEAACRKLVSRARQNIDRDKVRHITPRETQDSMLRAFQAAVMSGSTTQLSALLSTDIRLTTDSAARLSPPLGFLKARTC